MVTLVTGGIGSGKTTRMLELYRGLEPGTADGFASLRVFEGEELRGYELVRLAGPERSTLAVCRPARRGDPVRKHPFERFDFEPQGFRLGESILRSAAADPVVHCLFLDEVGPLELQGKGFAAVLREILPEARRDAKELVLCVRSGCVEALTAGFDLGRIVRFR